MGLADNAARNASNVYIPYGAPSYVADALRKSAAQNTYNPTKVATPAKPAAPVARYIPSYANPAGSTFQNQQAENFRAVQANPALGASRTTPTKTTPTKTTPTKTNLGTGSIETKTAPTTSTTTSSPSVAEKPLDVTLAQEDLQAVQNAADALRLFQENQAKAQLTDALAKIDRSALEQYAGIANDYAARGLARSGGKLMAEQKALDEVNRTKNEAQQAVTDFINELKLTGNLEQAKTNLSKSGAFQSWITDNYGTPGA